MGEVVTPSDLKSMGLVNRVAIGEDALDELVKHFAVRLASQPEVALHSVKLQFKGLYYREQLGNMTHWDADMSLIPSLRSKARGGKPTGIMSRAGNKKSRL